MNLVPLGARAAHGARKLMVRKVGWGGVGWGRGSRDGAVGHCQCSQHLARGHVLLRAAATDDLMRSADKQTWASRVIRV